MFALTGVYVGYSNTQVNFTSKYTINKIAVFQGQIHNFSTAKDTQDWGPSKTFQEAEVVAMIQWAWHSRPFLATPGSLYHDSQSHHQTLQCDQEWAHDPYSPVEEKANEPFLKVIDNQDFLSFSSYLSFSLAMKYLLCCAGWKCWMDPGHGLGLLNSPGLSSIFATLKCQKW